MNDECARAALKGARLASRAAAAKARQLPGSPRGGGGFLSPRQMAPTPHGAGAALEAEEELEGEVDIGSKKWETIRLKQFRPGLREASRAACRGHWQASVPALARLSRASKAAVTIECA